MVNFQKSLLEHEARMRPQTSLKVRSWNYLNNNYCLKNILDGCITSGVLMSNGKYL